LKLLEAIRRLVEIKLEGEELSDRPEVEAFISAARDYVERAMSGGLTEKQAWQAMHKLLHFNVAGRHFDEHGVEHYLQSKLFDRIVEEQTEGYATLETSPWEVLSDMEVAAPSPRLIEAGIIGSQRFDIVTGAIQASGKRLPEVLIELKRDLNDGQIGDDLLKLLRLNRVLQGRPAPQRLKTAICLGLRRISKWPLNYLECEKRVRSKVSTEFPTADLIFKSCELLYGEHKLLRQAFSSTCAKGDGEK
jgi:hypothetical protein